MSYRVTIDGNIGSGKTTQIKLLQEDGYDVFCEPIHEWPINLFYNDRKKWAFLMQMAVLEGFKVKSHIYERSPDSSICVFWNSDFVNPEEDRICKSLYKTYGWISDVYIYIDTNPAVCFERIQKRFQEGDNSVSLEYLEHLDLKYKEYIKTHKKVYIINGAKTTEEIHKEIISIIKGNGWTEHKFRTEQMHSTDEKRSQM